MPGKGQFEEPIGRGPIPHQVTGQEALDRLCDELGNIADKIDQINGTLREANAIARCLVTMARQTQREIDAMQ